MSRSIVLLQRHFSRLMATSGRQGVQASSSVGEHFPPLRDDFLPRISDLSEVAKADSQGNVVPVTLPALNFRQVYTFPTCDGAPVITLPSTLRQMIEKMDPLPENVTIKAPSRSPPKIIQLTPRILIIRRKKMKKHKRRKRFKRDFFKYQKYHKEKKLRAEREFVKRMKAHLAELQSFDPEKYVEETIAAAKKDWSDNLAPTGRKLHPHWSRLMSLEELYGIPKSDYIDKKAGLAGEEDAEKIKQLQIEYDTKFRSK